MDTDAIRQAMISYVKKDKTRFQEQFDRLYTSDALGGSQLVLFLRFRKELLEIKELFAPTAPRIPGIPALDFISPKLETAVHRLEDVGR